MPDNPKVFPDFSDRNREQVMAQLDRLYVAGYAVDGSAEPTEEIRARLDRLIPYDLLMGMPGAMPDDQQDSLLLAAPIVIWPTMPMIAALRVGPDASWTVQLSAEPWGGSAYDSIIDLGVWTWSAEARIGSWAADVGFDEPIVLPARSNLIATVPDEDPSASGLQINFRPMLAPVS